MERPKLKRDWEGLIVKTNRAITTGGGTIFPARTLMKVTRNHNGLHLEAIEGCDQCRIRHKHRVKGVSENDVVIVDDEITTLIARDNRAINYLLRAARAYGRSPNRETKKNLFTAAHDFSRLDTVTQ